MTKTFEICFEDLMPEAQKAYLDFIGAESEDDVNEFIPLAIIEVENEADGECKSADEILMNEMDADP